MTFPPCKITFCTFFEERTQFIYSEETYTAPTLFCVESGSFDYAIGGGKTYTVKRGEVVVCPPHRSFRRVMRETASFCMIRLVTESPLTFGDEPITPRDSERYFFNLAALRNCHFRYDFSDGQSDEHFCRDIWYLIHPVPAENSDSVSRAFLELCRNYAEPLTVESLAAEAGYSTIHFINRFKQRYGVTPGAQIMLLRLGRARELLETTMLSVREIAYAVGYGDEFYFSRLFHRHFGVSPRAFRKGRLTQNG